MEGFEVSFLQHSKRIKEIRVSVLLLGHTVIKAARKRVGISYTRGEEEEKLSTIQSAL